MYRIVVEANSAGELKQHVAELSALLAVTSAPPVYQSGGTHSRPAPVEETTAEVASEKKPVGRPRKAVETVAADPAPNPTPAPAPKAEKPKKYTLDQVRSALQTYAQKVDPDASVGILKVRELLAQYQSTKHVPCQKISEVQDQDYAALVAACGV